MALLDVTVAASHKNLPSSVNWQEKAKCVGCQIFCAAEHMEEGREQTELAPIAEKFNSASNTRAYQCVPVPHHIFYGTHGWMQTTAEPHLSLALTVFTAKVDCLFLR